jgi:hypothetical protein
MHDQRFAQLPQPPYYAVIFSSRRRGRDQWYRHFEVRVAKVERAYGWDRGDA